LGQKSKNLFQCEEEVLHIEFIGISSSTAESQVKTILGVKG
jgi:hypothetical protein